MVEWWIDLSGPESLSNTSRKCATQRIGQISCANTFKEEAVKAKRDKYETFCEEVTADKALIKFLNLYGAMHNKSKSRDIPDFSIVTGVVMRSDSEKGEVLFWPSGKLPFECKKNCQKLYIFY